MFAKTAIVALFSAFAAAQLHAPVGDPVPNFNAITRPLNEALTAGEQFTITWIPTEPGHTVSLLLLKGPSINVVPVGPPIAQGIPNSGSYTFTVPSEFGPGLTETTGYGIQIIDDTDGKYQYSTQFGITVNDYVSSSSAVVSSTPSASYGGYPTSTPVKSSSSSKVTSSANSTTVYAPSTIKTTHLIYSTGAPISNSSIIRPTGSLTVPSSLLTATSTSAGSSATSDINSPPESTGGASHLQAGLGLAAGVAGLFFML